LGTVTENLLEEPKIVMFLGKKSEVKLLSIQEK
jgi:hypothetical protein